VPTVVNAGLTKPFQADGRLGTLPEQALSAMRAHSEVTQDPKNRVLRRLAGSQEHLFSSHRVEKLSRVLALGRSLPNTDPPLTPLERAGKATFQQFCATCHGGPTLTVNTDASPARPAARSAPRRAGVREHLCADAANASCSQRTRLFSGSTDDESVSARSGGRLATTRAPRNTSRPRIAAATASSPRRPNASFLPARLVRG
jgi:cytochrome c peroxidase